MPIDIRRRAAFLSSPGVGKRVANFASDAGPVVARFHDDRDRHLLSPSAVLAQATGHVGELLRLWQSDDDQWAAGRSGVESQWLDLLADLGAAVVASEVVLSDRPDLRHRDDIRRLADRARLGGAEAATAREVIEDLNDGEMFDLVRMTPTVADEVVRAVHVKLNRAGRAELATLLTRHGLTAEEVSWAAERSPGSLHETALGWLWAIAEDDADVLAADVGRADDVIDEAGPTTAAPAVTAPDEPARDRRPADEPPAVVLELLGGKSYGSLTAGL